MKKMITTLDQVADVTLGYKSLQNSFYYLNSATIATFGIEDRYLVPISRLADLTASTFWQTPRETQKLFYCRDREADLRGTGAMRYIDAMAERAATDRKQSGKSQTMREALTAQGGRAWYMPKAQPAKHRIWIRKAFDGVFAPFLFQEAALVDQRCNGIQPIIGLEVDEVAAVLTSSLFAYSLEINGSTSMGAGVLEAPTRPIRGFPVMDVRALPESAREDLVQMARNVWKTAPVDWSRPDAVIPMELRELDSWLLARMESVTTAEVLHRDLRAVVTARLHVAKDKTKAVKTKRSDNVATVAQGVIDRIRKQLNMRALPDSFANPESLDLRVTVNPDDVAKIRMKPFVGDTEISIQAIDGSILFHTTTNDATAEMICRGILSGRGSFQVAKDRIEAHRANDALFAWLSQIEEDISKAVTTSSLGTGYEDILRREIIGKLGVDPVLFAMRLPEEISLRRTNAADPPRTSPGSGSRRTRSPDK